LRPDEASALKSLGQQHQALAVEPQHLDDVAVPTAEDEYVTFERVFGQCGLHQRGQAVEALCACRCGRPRSTPGCMMAVRSRQADHVMRANARSTVRRLDSSTAPRRRTRAPLMSVSIVPVDAVRGGDPGGGGAIDAGRSIAATTVTGSSTGVAAAPMAASAMAATQAPGSRLRSTRERFKALECRRQVSWPFVICLSMGACIG
jgi:hypothetical protein